MFGIKFLEDWSNFIYIVLFGLGVQQLLMRIIFPWCHRHVSRLFPGQIKSIVVGIIQWPLSFLIFSTSLYFGLLHTPASGIAHSSLLNLYRTAVAFSFFSVLYNIGDTSQGRLSRVLTRLGLSLDPILLNLLGSSIKLVALTLAFLTVAQEWGYNINGLIAGLGIGGLAIAMASKDALSNIFAGFVILTDKPFSIGDFIRTSGLEGTVETVTFRSTRMKTPEQEIIYVPNANLANVPITNLSKRSKRRARFTLGLTYSTTKEQMQSCVEQIKTFLEECDDLAHDSGDVFVAFAEYGPSSLDILVIYYTLATDVVGHTKVKEKVNFAIFDIVEKAGTSMAFPTQSLYFENELVIKK